MNYIMYSKPNCKFCAYARALFELEDVEYTELKLDVDFATYDFQLMFPSAMTYPRIVSVRSDGHVLTIGGYSDLVEHFAERI